MIIDANLRLMDNAAPVNSSGNTTYPGLAVSSYSTSHIDLSQYRDVGEGTQLYAVVEITQAFNTASAGFLLTLVTGDSYAGTSTVTVGSLGLCQASAAAGVTALSAGSKYVIAIAPSIANNGFRYLYAIFYGLSATAFTQGKMTIDIVKDVQTASTASANIYPSSVSFPS